MKVNRLSGFIFAALLAGATGSAVAVTDIEPGYIGAGGTASATPDPAAVQARLKALQQQVQLVNRFADRYQADAAVAFGTGFNAIDWKRQLGAQLMQQPANTVASAMTARDFSTAQVELAQARANVTPKHSSDTGNVINFLPTPCRIVDTRFGGGGMLGPAFRFWYAYNTPAIIAGQGGNPAGCGAFPGANLWFLYVTVVPPGAPLSGGANFLTVQHDAVGPTTSTMNYYPGVNIANFAITSNFDGTNTGGFNAYASGLTHVVIDLIAWGGTVAPAALGTNNQTATVDVLNASSNGVCTSACPVGYTLTGGGCSWGAGINGNGKVITESGDSRSPGGWCCQADNNVGVTRTLFAKAYCARAPGT